ncbi:MAG TPA: CDP-archaeol synthase [Polyangiaceae bacterium]|nr:CDP-archaeol synthase [Polyangiaceae bacterium]
MNVLPVSSTLAIAAAQALYFLSPLLVASVLSAVVLRFDLFPCVRRPIDGGRTYRGRRLLGDGKTWRGVLVAIVGSVGGVALQKYLLHVPAWLSLVDYGRVDVLSFGTVMGASAMAGELPNSFVKRRLGIARGAIARGPLETVFYVWDQVDMVTTVWPAMLGWIRPRPLVVAMSFAVAFSLHPLVSLVGYAVGARKSAR